MQITARTSGNCTVLELSGKLVLGKDQIELRNAVRNATEKNPSKIILNLAKVTYVDSCGIGELVNTYTHLKNLGANLALTDLPRKVRILLDIARLTPIFGISNGEPEANANFG